jgi:hypothetical protein
VGPGARDWLLLAGSLAFVAMGVLLVAVGRGGAVGVACVLFFGACAAIAAAEIVRKRRAARQDEDPSLVVRFEPGQTLRADARRIGVVSGGLAGFGALLAILGRDLGAGFVIACGLLALLGAGGLLALALGYTGRSGLRFTADALWVEQRGARYPVLWDSIVAVDLTAVNDQPIVRITVASVEELLARVEPTEAARTVARAIGWNRGLCGADLTFAPRAFGVDEVVLLRAVERYAGDPAARAELREKPALDGDEGAA